MDIVMKRLLVIILSTCIALTGASAAQTFEDYRTRKANLIALAGIFGDLHHVRRMCEPAREADIWRNRMKSLITLEDPDDNGRAELVKTFNEKFRSARGRYRVCDRNARDFAAARAQEGDRLVNALIEPLHAAIERDATRDASIDGANATPPDRNQQLAPNPQIQ